VPRPPRIGPPRRRRSTAEAPNPVNLPQNVAVAVARPSGTTGEYATTTDGRFFIVALRGSNMLSLTPRECVEVASRLLAGAAMMFKEEDVRGRRV
jgi:hypothetical protein